MTSFRRQVLTKAFMLFDIGAAAISLALAALPAWQLNATVSFANFLYMQVKMKSIVLFLLLLFSWHIVFSIFALYEFKRLSDRRSEVKNVLKATLMGTMVILLAAIVFRIRMVTPIFLAAFWVLCSSIAICLRLVLRLFLGWVRLRGRNLRHILIVGTNPRAVRFARRLESRPELGYRVMGFVDDEWAGIEKFRKTDYPLVAGFESFQSFLRSHAVDEVMVVLPMHSFYFQASRFVTACEEQGIPVRFLTNIFNPRLAQLRVEELGEEFVISLQTGPWEGWPLVVKRALDISISFTMIVFFLPLFLTIALLIKLTSRGPVLFVQERIGMSKRRFRMYKFRTMVADAEKKQAELANRNEVSPPAFKIKHDPRVTWIGKLLRKTSVDELPQLFNVLEGDMSLVGPRPLAVRDYLGVSQDWQRRRFSMRPGITCLWQINGRSTVPFDHWMNLDMQYIDHWSIWLDLAILAKTIPAVLKGTGAA